MNISEHLSANWKQLEGAVKKQWGKLSDDDLMMIAGKKEELEGKLQEKYAYTKDQAQKELESFCSNNKCCGS